MLESVHQNVAFDQCRIKRLVVPHKNQKEIDGVTESTALVLTLQQNSHLFKITTFTYQTVPQRTDVGSPLKDSTMNFDSHMDLDRNRYKPMHTNQISSLRYGYTETIYGIVNMHMFSSHKMQTNTIYLIL